MRRACRSSLVAFAALLAAAPAAAAQSPEPAAARRVTVTRNIREQVTPDRATVVLSVEATLADPADAAARLVTLERALADTLRTLGIPASAISVTPMGVSVVRQPGGYQPGIVQHSAQSIMRVSLDRIGHVATVSSAAMAKGGVHVNQPTFELAAEDSVRRVLVQRAIAEARRDAENIARSMGGRLGPIVDATQNTGTLGSVTYPEMVAFPSTLQFSGFGPRQPTSATIAATVTVRWVFVE